MDQIAKDAPVRMKTPKRMEATVLKYISLYHFLYIVNPVTRNRSHANGKMAYRSKNSDIVDICRASLGFTYFLSEGGAPGLTPIRGSAEASVL